MTANAARRRNFLRLMIAAGATATLVACASVFRILGFVPQGSAPTQLSWPRIRLVRASSLNVNQPVSFNYPLTNTPNLLVKLGVTAENGVGPNNDIVAYSTICQHLGCYFGYQAAGTSPPCNSSVKATTAEGYCCCHGGEYDLVNGAKVIGGPPARAVPAVKLEYDSATDIIYAVGMTAPTIFGHGPPGTTESELVLKYDLEGGELVTDESALST
jgi:arsenite oxidase small subunit